MAEKVVPPAVWLKQFLRWAIVDPWRMWFAVVAPLAALVPIFIMSDCEQRVRYTGMVFQLLGLLTVVWGLRDDRRLFREPSSFQRVLSWLRAFPGKVVPAVPTAMKAVPEPPGPIGAAAIPQLKHDMLLLERLGRLESAAEHQKAEIATLREGIALIRKRAKAALAEERIVRAKAVHEVNDMLHEAVAGDLSFDTIGIIYFLLGTFFGSASIELAPVLFGMRCVQPAASIIGP